MTQTHNGRPELDFFLVIAQQERAEAMARATYVLIDAVGRGVRATLAGITAGLRGLTKAARQHRRRRAGLRALRALNDRLLRDIGLTRADLWAVSNGTYLPAADEVGDRQTPAPIDVALSDAAIRGCNDNGARRRAA